MSTPIARSVHASVVNSTKAAAAAAAAASASGASAIPSSNKESIYRGYRSPTELMLCSCRSRYLA